MKTIAIAFGLTMLAGAAHAISDEGWFCPPGTELYQGQCWAPTQPEQPRGDVTAASKSQSKSSSASKSAAQANNSVNVDSSTRIRQSAASANAPQLNGYSFPNCFGDTNPSGSFSAGMQTFGWGVSASSSKASNVCAVAALAGPEAALRYLQRMDRNVPRNITVETPGRVTCPAGSTWDGKGCWMPKR